MTTAADVHAAARAQASILRSNRKDGGAPRVRPVLRLVPWLASLAVSALLLLPAGWWAAPAWAAPIVAAPVLGADTLTVAPGRGQELFAAHCAACHAGGGNIQRRGKTLRLAALERRQLASAEAISRIAAAGVGQMSGYGKVLGEGGAEAVGQWVWSQALAGWPQS